MLFYSVLYQVGHDNTVSFSRVHKAESEKLTQKRMLRMNKDLNGIITCWALALFDTTKQRSPAHSSQKLYNENLGLSLSQRQRRCVCTGWKLSKEVMILICQLWGIAPLCLVTSLRMWAWDRGRARQWGQMRRKHTFKHNKTHTSNRIKQFV